MSGFSSVCILERRAQLSGSAIRLSYPEHAYAKQLAETFEVMIVVQDVKTRRLCRHGNRQVGEGQTVGSMRAAIRQLAHRREYTALNGMIDRDLT